MTTFKMLPARLRSTRPPLAALLALLLTSASAATLAADSDGDDGARDGEAGAAQPNGSGDAGAGTEGAGERRLLEELVQRGARIGEIEVVVENVFDEDDPEERKPLYRWANRVHVTTRENVVEDVLLFAPGDELDPRLLEESERVLRAREFLVEASIEPGTYHEDTNRVDVLVTVRDGWSLSPEVKLGRSGGENELGIGVEESNLLGTGKGLTVSYSTDVDRDELYFGYADRNVGGTRAWLDLVFADTSDGDRMSISAQRPFFALDTRWSAGGALYDEVRIDQMYDLGETIDEFRHTRRGFSIDGGFSRGLREGRALRWLGGFAYEDNAFAPTADMPDPMLLPPDRKLVYPWVGFQLIEDDFRVMTELNDIGRTEDVPLGLNLTARIGFSSEGLGADRDATLLWMSAHKGWEPGQGKLLMFDAEASTRRESGVSRNSLVSAEARYYHRNLGDNLFLARLGGTVSNRLDPERQVLLGGDNGLRGYPLRYQSGEQSAIFTLEQRFFTDWYPLRLFRVGYAVFFDAGRVWGEDPRGEAPLGWLYDVGVGLRLTSPRSSSRQVVHIDLASPIGGDRDDLQLTVETKRSF